MHDIGPHSLEWYGITISLSIAIMLLLNINTISNSLFWPRQLLLHDTRQLSNDSVVAQMNVVGDDCAARAG